MTPRIDVIATTVSGSIADWRKVERIVSIFAQHGFENVQLHVAESHKLARSMACDAISCGGRRIISAGGSGTFNAVLEGSLDAAVPLAELRLGFLRKGSADLIGKVLNMPDEIEAAIAVFAESIRSDKTVPCDILQATAGGGVGPPRHFVGYGGAEIFGRIPHFTENRFMKWYKGVLSQLFGDLGPFTTGMSLALVEKLLTMTLRGRRHWRIYVDDELRAERRYQALIIVNGYLGPSLPYSSDPLGSGRFQLFGLRDLGVHRLLGQATRARSGAIMDDVERWGLERFDINRVLRLECLGGKRFPLNVDGSTLHCDSDATIRRLDSLSLMA
jgi:diacylglycerol kinase family enzyme